MYAHKGRQIALTLLRCENWHRHSGTEAKINLNRTRLNTFNGDINQRMKLLMNGKRNQSKRHESK